MDLNEGGAFFQKSPKVFQDPSPLTKNTTQNTKFQNIDLRVILYANLCTKSR